MYGRKVKLRFLFITLILLSLILSVYLILKSLEENVVYFKSPSDIQFLNEVKNKKIRVGGMVKINSIKISSNEVNFIITDFKNEINVSYTGKLAPEHKPPIEKEGGGQGKNSRGKRERTRRILW